MQAHSVRAAHMLFGKTPFSATRPLIPCSDGVDAPASHPGAHSRPRQREEGTGLLAAVQKHRDA